MLQCTWAVSRAMWLDEDAAKIDNSQLACNSPGRIAILVAVPCLKKAHHDAATGCQLTGVASLCAMFYADVACCNSALPALLPALLQLFVS